MRLAKPNEGQKEAPHVEGETNKAFYQDEIKKLIEETTDIDTLDLVYKILVETKKVIIL